MAKSKEELKKELQTWENKRFQNMLIDHWHTEEFLFDEECEKHIWNIQRELKKLEEEERNNG